MEKQGNKESEFKRYWQTAEGGIERRWKKLSIIRKLKLVWKLWALSGHFLVCVYVRGERGFGFSP